MMVYMNKWRNMWFYGDGTERNLFISSKPTDSLNERATDNENTFEEPVVSPILDTSIEWLDKMADAQYG